MESERARRGYLDGIMKAKVEDQKIIEEVLTEKA